MSAPFSLRPGASCTIPTTPLRVQAFPTLIRIFEGEKLLKEIALEQDYRHFVLMQEIMRGCVRIGDLRLLPNLELVQGKVPQIPQETLSFGCHKKQDWDLMRRRMDPRELLPLWFSLGSLLDLPPALIEEEGVFSLLAQCRAHMERKEHDRIMPLLLDLLRVGFSDMMVPRLFDEDHLGILPKEHGAGAPSPLYLLTEGSKLIRSLFFKTEGNFAHLLPSLPPECFCGQMHHLAWSDLALVDLEWSKKKLRRLKIRAKKDATLKFSISRFRVRTSKSDSGYTSSDSLEIKDQTTYFIDRI